MKAKKAIKRLHKVESLLGVVIDQFATGTKEVRGMLDAARSSVSAATKALAAAPDKKVPAKTEGPQPSRLSDAARKRLSVLAKKRWANAKRNGMSSLAKPARKTA